MIHNYFSWCSYTLILLVFTCYFETSHAQVGIGTSEPDPSSILHISSTDKGVLLPRVDLKNLWDKNTVDNPAEGLLVYNTNNDRAQNLERGLYCWDSNQWDKITNESDLSSEESTPKAYGNFYARSKQSLSDRYIRIIRFDRVYTSNNIRWNNSKNALDVESDGIFKVNAIISLNIDDDDAEDAVVEFYFTKSGEKVNGSSVYLTIDSSVDDDEKYTVALQSIIEFSDTDDLSVYARKANSRGEITELSTIPEACSISLFKL